MAFVLTEQRNQRGTPRRNATSRDVAQALQIAQSTVSRAFTAGASISPSLRDEIHKTAERLGYRPNLLARGLIAGRSKLIAVVLARQTNLLYPELLYEVSGRIADRGYQALLFPTDDSGAIEGTVERILAYRVDAVLATGVIDEHQAGIITGHHLPLVMINRSFDLPVPSVSCDFAAGARLLVARLLKAGHRQIGFVGGPKESYVSNEVEHGIRAAVATVPDAVLTAVNVAYSYEAGATAIDALKQVATSGAIVCVNDTVAAGVLDYLRQERGIHVPEDVSIVTFEGSGPAGWRGYRLTGMRQPVQEMVGIAVAMLLERIDDGNRVSERRLLMPTYVEGSTARIA